MLWSWICRGTALVNFCGFIFAGYSVWLNKTFSVRIPWSIPYGTFFIEVDPLSAFFLLIIFLLSGLCALYGEEYLLHLKHRKSLGTFWFFFNVLTLSMAMVVVSRNALLFLMAWEIMALSSFFLVTFEHENEDVSKAGWTYLVAAHLGTIFIFIFFITLGNLSGSFDFDSFGSLKAISPSMASLLFLCAIIGFGTKAGFIPFHVWLPEAHPAAPSHVSALMSGGMIKIGIYGLIRALMMLGAPPFFWWSYVLIGIGAFSGILGVLFALAQGDFKKLLAYSSVENMGIIALGLGLGLLGVSTHNFTLTILGFLGALLHILNHCFMKGLLFLSAGAVLHSTGTRQIDKMGGLLKKMPITGCTFLVGSIAVSGLPPFNGFISEFLIYFGALSIPSVVTIISLTLIGGLAVACFTKVFGAIFLGEPRSDITQTAHDPSWLMTGPMILLAVGCIAIGICSPFFIKNFYGVFMDIVSALGVSGSSASESLDIVLGPLGMITQVSILFLSLILLFLALRHFLFSHRKVDTAMTWRCGYAFPSSKMQYTASSFVQPITGFFEFLLGGRIVPSILSYFPGPTLFQMKSIDLFREKVYRPLFHALEYPLYYLKRFQYGRIQLYIFYIILTLIILLMWQVGIRE